MLSKTRRPCETDSLLGGSPSYRTRTSYLQTLAVHFKSDINLNHTELILLFCYVITGLLDSSAVFIWGSFASMQTGNTVYLGLGAIGADRNPSMRWKTAGISIASFCVGSLCFSLFHQWASPRRRWVLCCSFAVQLLCVVGAAVMVTVYRSEAYSASSQLRWQAMWPLALVAFQSSGQAVCSRVLNRNSMISVVLTSAYCDLFSVAEFPNPLGGKLGAEDFRRLGSIVCLVVGVLIGGMCAKTSLGLVGALWLVVFGKGLIVLAWLFWKGEDEIDMIDSE
ncbi:hypothetical protein BJX76DRAFT_334629 [Aspergillus varians]